MEARKVAGSFAASVPNPTERRSVIRHPTTTIEPVRVFHEEGEIVARVQDISIAGIGLLTRQRLEPGTGFVLEPAEPSRSLSPELRAEVRHATKSNTEDYVVGCRFCRLLIEDDVMALG